MTMKRKNYIFSLGSALCMGAAALAMMACSSEDNIVKNNPQQNAEVKTYTVNIPATFGDDAQTRAVDFDNSGTTPTAISSFATTDKIYVYKKSPSTAWLSWNAGTSTLDYLSPSQNGASCTLTGDITGQFAEGDVLELYYNMNVLGFSGDPQKIDECLFDYWGQDGTASGVADFAIATVKVKSIDAGVITFCQEADDTDETAHFENLSSMFRFKFTDGSDPISVKRLGVGSTNPALLVAYFPMATTKCEPLGTGYIPVTLATATSDYIYVGIGIDESSDNGDAMTFQVEGADGKVYTGTKAAPAAGFKKGKYYYSTSATTLAYQYTIQYPTITWTTPSTGIEPDYGMYRFDSGNFDFTLSGTSSLVHFNMGIFAAANGTIRLNGLTATFDDFDYIYNRGDLTLDITGDNTITCGNFPNCIVTEGNLKLSGNGTLTVTANDDEYCGLVDDYNYRPSDNSYDTTTELDVSAALAAPGYRVTRSARTYNSSEGTYTWTYTVYPSNVNLASLTGNFTAQDGQTLTGELGGNYKISIADGATVTLNNATINGTDHYDYPWAGITCDNDATIIISGTNTVKGFYANYPGIFIASGKTLTIQGTGSLEAICGTGSGSGGAGIGGGLSMDCGNIVINSGTITATAGYYSAGIGGGYQANCGNITINGGNITATGGYDGCGIGSGKGTSANSSCGTITITGGTVNATGKNRAAGIGSGAGQQNSPYTYKASCGAISISGTANVTATGGNDGGSGIGSGDCSNCSTIDISGGTVNATGQSLASGIGCGRDKSTCGAITITSDVTSVTATKGGDSTTATSIGKNGWSSTTCGTVTIGGIVYWDGSAYQNGGDDATTGLKHSPYVYAPSN